MSVRGLGPRLRPQLFGSATMTSLFGSLVCTRGEHGRPWKALLLLRLEKRNGGDVFSPPETPRELTHAFAVGAPDPVWRVLLRELRQLLLHCDSASGSARIHANVTTPTMVGMVLPQEWACWQLGLKLPSPGHLKWTFVKTRFGKTT